MKINFKRIISKGSFIPEIDGLRFIAIASVIAFHLSGFLIEKDKTDYTESYDLDFFNLIFSHGHLGVPLFFIISGFILARPFANKYLNNGSDINLKNYFIRRLTRLEPPYIIIMTILLFGVVFVAKRISLAEGIYSYLASITYTHNFFYGKGTLPLLNAVAWSLEIEIQFYIITPLLAMVFMIKNKLRRRLLIVGVSILFIIIDHYETLPFRSIINFFEYFLVGFLLADLYISNTKLFKKSKIDPLLSLILFSAIWIFDAKDFEEPFAKIIWDIIQLTSIFFFYYLVLFHKSVKVLSNSIITNIGGMCYTIYLLHYPIISMFGNPLLKFTFSNNLFINKLIYVVIIVLFIMIVSSIYFLLIERPCMKKEWHKDLIKRIFNKNNKLEKTD